MMGILFILIDRAINPHDALLWAKHKVNVLCCLIPNLEYWEPAGIVCAGWGGISGSHVQGKCNFMIHFDLEVSSKEIRSMVP